MRANTDAAEIFKQHKDAADLTDADKDTFIAFVNGNLRKTEGGKKVKIAISDGRFGAAGWRVVLRPDGAEYMVPLAPQGSPFAKSQVCEPHATASAWLAALPASQAARLTL